MLSNQFCRTLLIASASCTLFLYLFWSADHTLWRQTPQHKYNDSSGPGNVAPTIVHDTADAVSISAASPQNTPTMSDFSPSPFAYVFYATSWEYACSVLINIERLIRDFKTPHRIIVLVKPDLGSEYLTKFTSQNATVIPYQPPHLALEENAMPYYNDVLLKLISFRLHQYIPSLKRIIVMDSDQLILKNLDHLFLLPEVDVAAPRFYWGDMTGSVGFTSALMVVSLSDRVWSMIDQALKEIEGYTFDMEIVNRAFGKTFLTLPGSYCTGNWIWENNELPNWYRGIVPARNSSWKPRPPPPRPASAVDGASANASEKATYVEGSKTDETDQKHQSAEQESENDFEPKKANRDRREEVMGEKTAERSYQEQVDWQLKQDEIIERGQRMGDLLRPFYEEDAYVLHFTAVGKPWTIKSIQETREKTPNAHPLLVEQFVVWRKESVKTCPGFEMFEDSWGRGE